MKSHTIYEPGVINAFRLFTAVRLGIVLIPKILSFLPHSNISPSYPLAYFEILDVLALMIYLLIPGLEKRLKAVYLPIGLVLSFIGPSIEQVIFLNSQVVSTQIISIENMAWQTIPVLFIPLFIISWQYNFRWVVISSLLSATLDFVPPFLILVKLVPLQGYFIIGPILVRTVSFIFIGYMISHMMSTQRKLREDLAKANSDLTQYAVTLEQLTISRERNRLARELHDVLAHTLSGLAIELEAVKKIWTIDSEKARSMLDHSLVSVREGLTETRRALTALRASPLEDLGLLLALRHMADSVQTRSGFKLNYIQSENISEYPPEVEMCFYRITQESLNNIAKHSGASQVTFSLLQESGKLSLTIADNGSGFDLSQIDPSQQFGLMGMKERAAMIDAKLEVTSQASIGTTIYLSYEGVQ